MTQQTTFETVAGLLVQYSDVFVGWTYEHPGYIAVRTDGGGLWNVGTAAGTWGADLFIDENASIEGEGCRGAEIGRYANHEMALMFPIVPLTFLYDSLDQTDGPAEWTATKRNECAGGCQQRQCGLRLMLNRPAKQPGCNAAA